MLLPTRAPVISSPAQMRRDEIRGVKVTAQATPAQNLSCDCDFFARSWPTRLPPLATPAHERGPLPLPSRRHGPFTAGHVSTFTLYATSSTVSLSQGLPSSPQVAAPKVGSM